jgi:hypothetical protein
MVSAKVTAPFNSLRDGFHDSCFLLKSQGCQIFHGTIYQNGDNITDVHKIEQMAIK